MITWTLNEDDSDLYATDIIDLKTGYFDIRVTNVIIKKKNKLYVTDIINPNKLDFEVWLIDSIDHKRITFGL